MRYFQRRVGTFVLLALLLTPLLSLAQGEPITVVGSLISAPIFSDIANASPNPVTLTVTPGGTNSGFNEFCQGQADVTNASRPISVAEDATCASNNVSYLELLLGYNIIAVVSQPGATYAQCLTTADLTAIFAPSAEGQMTNWNQVNSNDPDLALSVFIQPQNSPIYSVLDGVVDGDGFRADATTANTDADVLSAVTQTEGALGVMSLAAATAAGDTVQIVQIDDIKGDGCVMPAADAVEAGTYAAGDRLYTYVNTAKLDQGGLGDFITFATSDAAASVISQAGFIPPTADAYAKNTQVIREMQTGRRVTQQVVAFQIPPGVSGPVNVAGAAGGFSYIKSISDNLTAAYSGITMNLKTQGVADGLKQLCAGTMDIAIVYATPTPEQMADCSTSGVATLPISLGSEATVLVGHASDSFQTCLTKDQLLTLWRAGSDPAITNWNQVSDTFPDLPVTLLIPSNGDPARDVLMIGLAGTDLPDRADPQLKSDPLYRAAAVANVDGGITYMSWSDYQKVVANNQADIQLVSVDGGSGCVAPSEETIKDGSYVISRQVQLLVNRASLTNLAVESLLWSLAAEENYGAYQQAEFVGLSVDDMAGLRNTLQAAFEQSAQGIGLTATPEVMATSEATPEATTETAATAEATPATGG